MNITEQTMSFIWNSNGKNLGKRFLVLSNALLSFAKTAKPLNKHPVFLQIEPTSRCNLDCVMCLRKSLIPFGDMTFEKYKELLDSMPYLHGLWLQGQGEPLLHKDIFKMVREAKSRGISTLIITNGTLLTKEKAIEAETSGLDELGISFNSTDKDTYESIMRNASFDMVVENIRYAASLPMRRMKVFFSVTIMKSNQNEINNIIAFADEIGIDEVIFRPLAKGGDYAKGFVDDNYAQLMAVRTNGKVKVTFKDKQICRWPWQSMYVAWNGNVMPCCHIINYDALKLGNAFDGNVWKSNSYNAFRKRMINKQSDICNGCRLYGG